MKNPIIRTIYLYLFTLIGLAMVTVGTARIVNVGLKAWVFREADVREAYYEPSHIDDMVERKVSEIDYVKKQQHRDLASSISTIIVGLPLYLYHWVVIKGDSRRREDELKKQV